MIPRANITAWRALAPWPSDAQVEQDLVLSRALVAIFGKPDVADQIVFRGGTALRKLFFDPPERFSEDIALVQREAGPIGGLINSMRDELDSWLGEPKWKQGKGRFTLIYRFETSFEPVVRMRLKIEINTREHFSVLGLEQREYSVINPWFSGSVALTTYKLAELLGTKMRAFYQRKKGRDLYDLWRALRSTNANGEEIVKCFKSYMERDDAAVSRAEFEANLAGKTSDDVFLEDLQLLLPMGVDYDPISAAAEVREELLTKLPGKPWKGSQD